MRVGVIILLLIAPTRYKQDLLDMKQVLRTAWLLIGIVSLAAIYLIPQTLIYIFPSDSTTQVAIRELGINQADFLELAKRHGVVTTDIHFSTLHTPLDSPSEANKHRLISIEAPGSFQIEKPSKPLSPYFLRSDIAYQVAFEQTDALGPWYVTGDDSSVQSFIRDLEDTWPEVLIETTRLTPHSLLSTTISSQIGKLLLLSATGLTILIILSTVSGRTSYRADLIAGAPHSRLGRTIVAAHLISCGAWILVPLLALGILIVIDISRSTLLSVHRMMFLLSRFALALLFSATLIGSLIGWTWTALLTRQRASDKSPQYALVTLLYITTIAMRWTFCSSATEILHTITLAQSESGQAVAQHSLPRGAVLGLRHLTEPTYAQSEARMDEFFTHMNDQHLLAVISPSEQFGGATEDPKLLSRTLYLNNTAASYYGLPMTTEEQVAIYRSLHEHRTDSEIAQDLHDQALFEARYGATCEHCEATILNNDSLQAQLPPDLPRASYFQSDSDFTTSDFTIAVVPDTFFSPSYYLSALSRGEIVFLDDDPMTLRHILASFNIDAFFGRYDAVGEGSDTRLSETTWPILVHSSILAVSFVGTLATSALTGSSFAKVRKRRREIGRMFGKRFTHEVVPLSVAILSPPFWLSPALSSFSHRCRC